LLDDTINDVAAKNSVIHIAYRVCCIQAVLVDMEEGVLSEVMRSPLGELFDSQQFIKDVSGSGNNW